MTNLNLPALKYGIAIETEACSTFIEAMKLKHTDLNVAQCGLYLNVEIPYVGGSPDGIVTCSCCPPACLEIKCLFSINCRNPCDDDVELPYIKKDSDGIFYLHKNHRYFTVSSSNGSEWTFAQLLYGMDSLWPLIDKLMFDSNLWELMKNDFLNYYEGHYLKTIFSDI